MESLTIILQEFCRPEFTWPVISRHSSNHDYSLTERLLEQGYFWLKEWQGAEDEATDDIKNGRVIKFSNAQDVINHLRSSQ